MSSEKKPPKKYAGRRRKWRFGAAGFDNVTWIPLP